MNPAPIEILLPTPEQRAGYIHHIEVYGPADRAAVTYMEMKEGPHQRSGGGFPLDSFGEACKRGECYHVVWGVQVAS